MTKHPGTTTPIQPRTKEYKEAFETGRMCITINTVGGKKTMYCVNIYGWTNRHVCRHSRRLTNNLVLAIICELQHIKPMPTAFTCDLNADYEDIPALNISVRPRMDGRRTQR